MYIRLLSAFLVVSFHRRTSQECAVVCKTASTAYLLLIMLLCPVAGHAAGLGRLAVNSALGQPFKAEIDLVAVKKEEMPSLTVRLAPQEIFRQANVDYMPLLSTFKASIENRPDGQLYVKIISPQPVADPLLNMLIELNWSSGRLLREYTVVLAPPEIDADPAVAPSIQTMPPVSIKTESATAEKPGLRIKNPASGEKPLGVPESASVSKTHTVYGPVKRGDTLGGIVRNIAPPAGVSFNQMLVALHRANRDAFFGNNMHRLKTGPILRVPDGSEIGMITRAEADKEVKMQTVDWNRHRLADVVGSIPAAEELKQTVAGKIEPTAGADSAEAQESRDGFLKLSQGKELWNAGNADGKDIGRKNLDGKDGGGRGEAGGVQDRIRAMEEDAIAKSRSLSEANERIALLEKNIKELRRLLELKNLALADMQQAEAAKPDAATLPAPPAALSPQPVLTPEPLLATQSAPVRVEAGSREEGMITSLATTGSATEIAKPMQAAAKSGLEANSTPRQPAKNSLIDDLTANIEYFGGALVLLIAGIVGVSLIGRPNEESADNSSVDMTSVRDLPLHDKALPLAVTADTNTATQADKAVQAAEAGTYLHANGTPAGRILKDVSAGDPRTPEIGATPDTSGTPVNLINSSEPVSSLSVSPAPSIMRSAEPGLSDVSFNLDATQSAKPAEVMEKNTHWHEIVTKLDLARAYQEMGDRDGARQVLQEVTREGDAQQQESATLMLANL